MAGTVWHRGDVAYVESPGRVALLGLEGPADPPVILEGSAAAIWGLVDGQRDESAVVAAVVEQYDAPLDEVAASVAEFLTQLEAVGLLRRA